MPDLEQFEAEASTSEPTTEVVQSQTVPVEAVETSTETATPEPKTYSSADDALADADFVERLLKDDRVAGRIGQVADRRAREIAAAAKTADDLRKQQDADRAEETRLRELRRTSPVEYANEIERRESVSAAVAEEAARQTRITSDVTGSLADYVRANFPKEIVDSLAGKTYEGTYAQGVTAYIADITKAHETTLRAKWEKDELPALRKKLLTEINGGEPPIDSSAGPKSVGKQFKSNYEASTALMNGEITKETYRQLAYKHGWR